MGEILRSNDKYLLVMLFRMVYLVVPTCESANEIFKLLGLRG